jgi:SAM-dependent methyltransferase
VLSWARLRPKRIFATDLFQFENWNDVARECRDRWRVSVEFRQAPLEDTSFLPSESIDLCASDAVFEHCRDLPSVLAESHRLLRSDGRLCASFGPLWFCPGGDHFSTRGGLTSAYAHIELAPDAYREFFCAHKRSIEDFQSGGRYVELDLFSKLTPDEYLERFRGAGFRVDSVVVGLCPLALEFERRFPGRWRELVRKLHGVATADDLRTKGMLVRLMK